ncbi:MAG: B12-binding domain-containing radical SAM protein, partial [Verrucomicrobiaceae bacterium]
MSEIVLATLNAKFIHAAFGLRYLFANLGELKPRAALREFDINQRVMDIAEAILAEEPRILGLGVYIWNVVPTTELVAILKRTRPDLIIILGGPEVSYEVDQQEIVRLADYVITGEADLTFAEVCRKLLAGERPEFKIIPAALPDVNQLALPYDLYDERDVTNRLIYVEASRGCPFTCEFCLSSLEIPVRAFELEPFLAAMQGLLERGVQQFKFVDRTFNLNLRTSSAILQFFLDRMRPGLFVHFEMVPDRLPEGLRELIAKFPPGSLQFEVGIQSFTPEVEKNISRRQNHDRLAENFNWLREKSGVHIHADLIVGLPGETLQTFAAGFDRLVALRPQEIQVGILKRLRGTPIIRHDTEWEMRYSPLPPYEILQNRLLDFRTMQRLRRFAKFWDVYGNSGNFVETLAMIWGDGSPFAGVMRFSDW